MPATPATIAATPWSMPMFYTNHPQLASLTAILQQLSSQEKLLLRTVRIRVPARSAAGRRPAPAAGRPVCRGRAGAGRQLPLRLAHHRPDPARRSVRGAPPRLRLPGRRTGVHRPAEAGAGGPAEGSPQGARPGTPRRSRALRRLYRPAPTRQPPHRAPRPHAALCGGHSRPG